MALVTPRKHEDGSANFKKGCLQVLGKTRSPSTPPHPLHAEPEHAREESCLRAHIDHGLMMMGK